MVVPVVSQFVPLTNNALHELGVQLSVLAQHEERGTSAVGFESVEDFRCRVGRRSIVERQRHNLPANPRAIDNATKQWRARSEHPPNTDREQQNHANIEHPCQPAQVHPTEHAIGDHGGHDYDQPDHHSPQDRLVLRHAPGPFSSSAR